MSSVFTQVSKVFRTVKKAVKSVVDFVSDEIIDPINEYVFEPLMEHVFQPIAHAVFKPLQKVIFEPLGMEKIGYILEGAAASRDVLTTAQRTPRHCRASAPS
jgi:hypothetical protein